MKGEVSARIDNVALGIKAKSDTVSENENLIPHAFATTKKNDN